MKGSLPYSAVGVASEVPQRPVHTYSIVARDPNTGEMAVAVQSHWFSVGSVVSWAEPGVGAIATQSFVNASCGPRGLDMLRHGQTAREVLDALVAGDEGRDVRQLAIVDAQGNVATHTGARRTNPLCLPTGVSQRVLPVRASTQNKAPWVHLNPRMRYRRS